MFRYVRDEAFAGIPVVVDLVDVDSRKWLDCAGSARGPSRWLYRLESRRVRQLERELVDRSRAVTVVSKAEADLFRESFPNVTVHSVPNGVDLDPCGTTRADNGLDCVFVGALDYFPNVEGVSWFCREVWPHVYAQFPQARFQIVGRQPTAQIRRLALLPGVHVVGEVPDVRPYLRQARLAVIPLRIARGIQNKVLEAMAAATPVVASSQALEGLVVISGEHVLQADAPRDWVAQICALLKDHAECRRLGAASRAFVSEHHRWEDCLQPFERILGMPRQSLSTELSPVLS
jgi:sugar transferase (PEP-CTERM/EpsH1 system associated)